MTIDGHHPRFPHPSYRTPQSRAGRVAMLPPVTLRPPRGARPDGSWLAMAVRDLMYPARPEVGRCVGPQRWLRPLPPPPEPPEASHA